MNSIALSNGAELGIMMFLKKLWHRHFLGTELALSLILVLLFALLVEGSNLDQSISKGLNGLRVPLYTAVAAVAGSILGFALAGISILIAFFSNSRLEKVTESRYYAQVYRIYMSAIRYLALTVGLSLLAIILDRDSDPSGFLEYILLWSVLISTFRLARCVWVMERIIEIITTRTEPF